MKKNIESHHNVFDVAVKMMCEELFMEERPVQVMVFHLDECFNVLFCNHAVGDVLTQSPEVLKQRPIDHFIARESEQAWDAVKKYLKENGSFCCAGEILFRTVHPYLVPTFCFISSLVDLPEEIFLFAVTTTCADPGEEDNMQRSIGALKERLKLPDQATCENPLVPPKTDDDWVRYVVDEILPSKNNPVLNDLADEAGMSISKFKGIFKRQQGVSVQRFLIDARVRKAKQLLSNPGMPIKNVAHTMGYKLPAFIRMFKRETGITPSQYRAHPCGEHECLKAMAPLQENLEVFEQLQHTDKVSKEEAARVRS